MKVARDLLCVFAAVRPGRVRDPHLGGAVSTVKDRDTTWLPFPACVDRPDEERVAAVRERRCGGIGACARAGREASAVVAALEGRPGLGGREPEAGGAVIGDRAVRRAGGDRHPGMVGVDGEGCARRRGVVGRIRCLTANVWSPVRERGARERRGAGGDRRPPSSWHLKLASGQWRRRRSSGCGR